MVGRRVLNGWRLYTSFATQRPAKTEQIVNTCLRRWGIGWIPDLAGIRGFYRDFPHMMPRVILMTEEESFAVLANIEESVSSSPIKKEAGG